MSIKFFVRTLKSFSSGNDAADKILSLFLDPLKNKEIVLTIVQRMEEEMNKVLSGRKSVLKKKHTFIQNFPDGKESGDFLGVHFSYGIINLAGITVNGLRTVQALHETLVVPEEERLLRGTERVLFVAKSIKDFSQRIRVRLLPDINPSWSIGVNYGYLKEEGRTRLDYLHSDSWPDEYNFTGEPVRMRSLQTRITEAADSIGFQLKIKGFLRTPEAVFLDSNWKYRGSVGGMSLEHRCHICVKELTSRVKKVAYKDDDKPYILLRILWETFGQGGELDSILNDFDKQIENEDKHNKNIFQYLVDESYIIKLVVLVLHSLSDQGIIFKSNEVNKNKIKAYLQEKTHGISTMGRSYSRGMGDILQRTFHFQNMELAELSIIKSVVEVISWRAALFMGMVITVLTNKMAIPDKEPVFLINGLYLDKEMLNIKEAVDYILDLKGTNEVKPRLEFSVKSKVFGAAVLAAIYTKNPFDYDADYINDG